MLIIMYCQADLGGVFSVEYVGTQGRGDMNKYVRTYNMAMLINDTVVYYTEGGSEPKVLRL